MKEKVSMIVYKLKKGISSTSKSFNEIDDTKLRIWLMIGGIGLIAILCTIIIVFKPNRMEVSEQPDTQIQQAQYAGGNRDYFPEETHHKPTVNTQSQQQENSNYVYVDIGKLLSSIDKSGLTIETPLKNTQSKLVLAELGLDTKMLRDYAVSIDLKGESTHAIAILLPEEGFEQRVKQELLHYVSDKQRYIEKRGNDEALKLAKQAVVNTFGDYIVLVMENKEGESQKLIESIRETIIPKDALPKPQLIIEDGELYEDEEPMLLH